MDLHFLDFDHQEGDDGIATWDAMACVNANRAQPLLDEIELILRWAHAAFGAPADAPQDAGVWQYDLQCERADQPLWELHFDPVRGRVARPPGLGNDELLTVNFCVSGDATFAQAVAAQFGLR